MTHIEPQHHRASVHTFFRQLATRFDPETGTVWLDMQSRPRPCFTPQLLDELRKYQRTLENNAGRYLHEGELHTVHYQVLTSSVPGVYNLGGDLDRFLHWIALRDRNALLAYGRACIDVLYPNAIAYQLPLTTISLVRGQALGGGFEAALSGQVLIAEESAQLGLPEILFNLFPGMGAYPLLCSRVTPAQAERLILGGKIHKAAELQALGIVDEVVEDGCGVDAVQCFIRRHARQRNGYLALQRARRRHHRLSYQELVDVTEIWVDAALSLSKRDLKVIERLVRAQDRSNTATATDGRSARSA